MPSYQNEVFKESQFVQSKIQNQNRLQEQVNMSKKDLITAMSESHIEDGSSGGEGTTKVMAARARSVNLD